jgi:hypothetical protein
LVVTLASRAVDDSMELFNANIVTVPFLLDLEKGNPHTYHEATLSKILLPVSKKVVSAGVIKEIGVF